MSEHVLPMGARAHDRSDAFQLFLGYLIRAGAAVQSARQAQARQVVSATARRYSKRDLVEFGWSDQEIRRLQSK